MQQQSPPLSVSPRKRYHHGNLHEVLVATAIAMIEEKGVEALSVRDVAKRAGVSPGAPFRHFASKQALLTAVAEQAMGRLTGLVQESLAGVTEDDPIARLHAIGLAYLRWGLENPTHFQIVSSRSLIDFAASERLRHENEMIRVAMENLLTSAQAKGQLRDGIDPVDLMLAARAFAYGLVRMWNDGHFPEWQVSEPYPIAMRRALDLFVYMFTRR